MKDARAVRDAFAAAWEPALAAWSAHTLLREPNVLTSEKEAQKVRMGGQIAAIRLADATILVNLERYLELGLQGCERAILAHEIGHHIYVPGNMADHVRLFAVLRRTLVGLPDPIVALCANLWADSLINDRLVQDGGEETAAGPVGIVEVYRRLRLHHGGESDRVWRVYARSLEVLWREPRDSLVAADGVSDAEHADAALLARIVRVFARDWIRGGRRYAAVLLRHFAEDLAEAEQRAGQNGLFVRSGLHDTESAGRDQHGESGDLPAGVMQIDPAELEPLDGDLLEGAADATGEGDDAAGGGSEGPSRPGGNARPPFEVGQLLRAMGLDVDDHALVTRYYKELAMPHLLPFPSRSQAPAMDEQPEGLDPWEAGDALEKLDLMESLLQSPMLVPGVTTVQRRIGWVPGLEPAPTPLDLDIYVDCSGSMPDPRHSLSYLTLSATVLALSCLRAGGRVQATLWSGPGVFDTTGGFTRDERRVLGMVTGFVSGATAFPLHLLRDTYAARKPHEGEAHVVVISDDGIDTMLAKDEHGRPGKEVVAEAMARAGGGGTLVLNLGREPERYAFCNALSGLGFRIFAVRDWSELVAFSRAFVRERWGDR